MNHSLALNIADATVFLGGREILHHLSWQVRRGEHHFILGANGAGKTTLVKMLMGFVWPVYGATVEVLGERYGAIDLRELRRRIAWVSPFLPSMTSPEATGLEVVLSGIDGTLGFFRRAAGRENELAHEALARLGAEKLAGQSLYSMSSGEQVKVLIARALMTRPELVILDEASVYLDITSREYLLETIDQLTRDPEVTVLFVTQRIEDIIPAFPRGLILDQGAIAAAGDREEVLSEANLSRIFGLPIRLIRNEKGRYWPIID